MPNSLPHRRYIIARRLLTGATLQAIAKEYEVGLHRVQAAWKNAMKPIFLAHVEAGIDSTRYGRTLDVMRQHVDYWLAELDRQYGNRVTDQEESPFLPCCWCGKYPSVERRVGVNHYRLVHLCEVVDLHGIDEWLTLDALVARWNTRRGTPPSDTQA